MQTILQGLNSVPGVMGAVLSNTRSDVLAHSMPSFFDEKTMNNVATMINDNLIGLQDATGGVKLFDIRGELGRILIKIMPNMILAVLCEQSVNTQLLQISLNVATKKLEQIPAEQLVAASAPAAKQVTAPPAPVAQKADIPAIMRGFGRW